MFGDARLKHFDMVKDKQIKQHEKRPRALVDGTLTLGIGYSITPFTEFLNPLGMENRV